MVVVFLFSVLDYNNLRHCLPQTCPYHYCLAPALLCFVELLYHFDLSRGSSSAFTLVNFHFLNWNSILSCHITRLTSVWAVRKPSLLESWWDFELPDELFQRFYQGFLISFIWVGVWQLSAFFALATQNVPSADISEYGGSEQLVCPAFPQTSITWNTVSVSAPVPCGDKKIQTCIKQ